ncbi:hypothetical protein LY76DRAFT_267045 [Colletotrichum caudatum]|nr:hypothetical protein LY76DRAFT_267045 [Colletotrichum caudatum]
MHIHTCIFIYIYIYIYIYISTWPNAWLSLGIAGYRVLPGRLIMIDPSIKKSLCPFSRVSLLLRVLYCPPRGRRLGTLKHRRGWPVSLTPLSPPRCGEGNENASPVFVTAAQLNDRFFPEKG